MTHHLHPIQLLLSLAEVLGGKVLLPRQHSTSTGQLAGGVPPPQSAAVALRVNPSRGVSTLPLNLADG